MLGQERWMPGTAGEIQGHETIRKTLELEGMIVLKMDPQEVGWGGMDWIDLAEDRDRWQAFVNVVMKGNFLTS
jgi:hypothetical protein